MIQRSLAIVFVLMSFTAYGRTINKDSLDNTSSHNRPGISIGINQFPWLADDRTLSFHNRVTKFNITKYFFMSWDNLIRIGLDVSVAPSSSYKYYFSCYYGGLEHTFSFLSDRFTTGIGGDVILQQDYKYIPKEEIRTTRFGIAPLLSVQCRILSFLSMRTELSYAFSVRNTQYRNDLGQYYTSPNHQVTDLSLSNHRLLSLELVFHI